MTLFSLKVLSPEKDFFEGMVSQIVFTTPMGRVGVMAGHTPMVAAVTESTMEINDGESWRVAAIGQGFAEIMYESAEFFLDTAEWADEIDEARAREALERAEHRIKHNISRIEYLRTQAAMSRALARLKAVESMSARMGRK